MYAPTHYKHIESGFPTVADRAMVVPPTKIGQPSLDVQIIEQILEVGIHLGEAINSLKSQKEILVAANQGVKTEISRIKQVHLSELDAAVNGWEAKRKSLVEKLTLIAGKIHNYSLETKLCFSHVINTSSLQTLIDSIPLLNVKLAKSYPLPSKGQLNSAPLHEEISSSWEDLLQQTSPIIRETMLKGRHALEFESLRKDVNLLRSTQEMLNLEKKSIIEFHASFMKRRISNIESQLGLKEICGKAELIINGMDWNIKIPSATKCPSCCNLPVTPRTKQEIHKQKQEDDLQSLNILLEKINEIMSSLKKEMR